MIYFFYGTDLFRMHQRILQLRKELLSSGDFGRVDRGLDYQALDALGLSFANFISVVSTQSLLTSRKMIVIEDLIANGSEGLKESIISWLDRPPNEIVIIFRENNNPDQRTRLFKALSSFQVEHYGPLRPAQVHHWLDAEARRLELKLSFPASQMLARNFSNDLWRLSKELEKLSSFSGRDKVVDEKILIQLVPPVLNDNIFQTIDALAKKDLALANRLINIQLTIGMNEQQLLVMIAYQFRNTALVKALIDRGVSEKNLAAVSRLHPYVAKKVAGFARGFSSSQLSRIFYIIHKVDIAIKNGRTPPRVGLDILMAQVANSSLVNK